MQESPQSNQSTGLDLRASPDERTSPFELTLLNLNDKIDMSVERNKTVESAKESGLMGLKKKVKLFAFLI